MVVFHPTTDTALSRWRQALPQSGFLYGPKGVGLLTAAKDLVSNTSSVLIVSPEKATKTSQTLQIGVERIRELYMQTRTKSDIRRIVIIDDADLMSLAAQNAFLKLLEEPNDSTSFIVLSHQPERLLPTVRSRLQSVYVKPISDAQTRTLLSQLHKPDLIDENQLLFLANGLPAELSRLLQNQAQLDAAIKEITFAKNILQASAFDKLALVTKQKPDRQAALILIEHLLKLLRLKPTLSTPMTIEKLLDAYKRINGGGNIQLQLITALL